MTVKTKPCLYCGEPFTPERSTAKYCSPAHRVAHHRSGLPADLSPEEAEFAIPFEQRERERKAAFKQYEREYDAERRRILQDSPLDFEDRLEAAERHYWQKMWTWEPEALRKQRRVRRT